LILFNEGSLIKSGPLKSLELQKPSKANQRVFNTLHPKNNGNLTKISAESMDN